MISLEKWYILTRLQKLPKNVGDLDKLFAAKGFKKWPKVQLIAQSAHTAADHKLTTAWTSHGWSKNVIQKKYFSNFFVVHL